MNVLIATDDERVGKQLVNLLASNGFWPSRCRLGVDMLNAYGEADLVMLDVTLPDIDGLEALRTLRRASHVPVLVMSSRGDERSVVVALRAGADDYLVKPLRIAETLARVQAATRRALIPRSRSDSDSRKLVRVEEITVDLTARAVWVHDTLIPLSTKEYDLLVVLARNAGQAVSRDEIIAQVWGSDHCGESRALDVHMTSIRAKLKHPDALRTIRGYGYRLGATPPHNNQAAPTNTADNHPIPLKTDRSPARGGRIP